MSKISPNVDPTMDKSFAFDSFSSSDADLPTPRGNSPKKNSYKKKLKKSVPCLKKYVDCIMKNVYTRVIIGILVPMFILAIPIVLIRIFDHDAMLNGISVFWFFIWLEVIYFTFWAVALLAKLVPIILYHVVWVTKIQTWMEVAMALHRPIAIFLWTLVAFVTFKTMMTQNPINREKNITSLPRWGQIVNNILTSLFIGAILYLIEKFLIQMLAVKFHERTYRERIIRYKSNIKNISHIFKISKKLMPTYYEDVDNFNSKSNLSRLQKIKKYTRSKIAAPSLNVLSSGEGMSYYQRIVQEAISDPVTASGLTRRFFKAFGKDESDTFSYLDICRYTDREHAKKIFEVFDPDLEGSIKFEEMELTCIQVGAERKSVLSSLRDVDSAVAKFDSILVFIVILITLIFFAQLMSSDVQALISSASTTLLALSWLFSATAQEVLGSVLFVFVKHPFDVDDIVEFQDNVFIVKEMQLLATIFTRADGKIMQAPNNILNTYLIYNVRRSYKIGEGVDVRCWFGTPFEDLEAIRLRLVAFCQSHKKYYDSNVTMTITEYPSLDVIRVNYYFTHKTNWQNRGLYLRRRNLFLAKVRDCVTDIGLSLTKPTEPKKYTKLTVPKVPLDLPQEGSIPHDAYVKLVRDRIAYMSQIRGKDLLGKVDKGFGLEDSNAIYIERKDEDLLNLQSDDDIDDTSTDGDGDRFRKVERGRSRRRPTNNSDAIVSIMNPQVPVDPVGQAIMYSAQKNTQPSSNSIDGQSGSIPNSYNSSSSSLYQSSAPTSKQRP